MDEPMVPDRDDPYGDNKKVKELFIMRKCIAVVLSSVVVLSMAACSSQQQQETPSQASSQATSSAASTAEEHGSQEPISEASVPVAQDEGVEESSPSTTTLIAYFSVPETDGVDTVAGASRVVVDGEVLGNNQYIAQLIQQETGGDLFRIETVQEYPGSHDPLLEFAYNELTEDARPELASQLENLDQYDVIFLGYPNWNSNLPMPLYTFLETYDFSGKTIIPFTVHGGSGFSRTIQTIQELQPNATVIENGLSISRNNVAESSSTVFEWLGELSL